MTAQTAVLPVAPVPEAPAADGSRQKKRRVMKTGREDGTGVLGVGVLFWTASGSGGSSAAGVCVISQPANENI